MAAPKRGWTQKELDYIKKLLVEDGISYQNIADMFGVNRSAIRGLNRKYKWVDPRPPTRGWTQEELDYIKKLIEEGKSFRSIAKIFGVISNTITALNRKYKWRDFDKERDNRDEKILELYLLPEDGGRGLTKTEVQKRLRVSKPTIDEALRRFGFEDKIRGQSEENVRRWSNPEEREKQRSRITQFYENHPEAAAIHSQRMIEWWDQFGTERGERLKNRLLFSPSRQQAINILSSFVSSVRESNPQKASAIYNNYIKIINNHTFPDEVQPQPV